MKYVIILVVGIAIGYGYGWKDAKVHKENVVTRMVGRVGGSNRRNLTEDIDKKVDEGIKR
jgi:hypothetical protein